MSSTYREVTGILISVYQPAVKCDEQMVSVTEQQLSQVTLPTHSEPGPDLATTVNRYGSSSK